MQSLDRHDRGVIGVVRGGKVSVFFLLLSDCVIRLDVVPWFFP